ncbi:Fe(3+)-hydroxamate ABC transporter permease FhuB [Gemmobacter sp. 24YEA27]|uniref:Fe(3+)-hydroxamate ABC transporter permease FhuB n=1 Tax=Gemmobacter sp. 24YEA27 TaxID=3040672 RepID=UPI0024B33596|nr:Fe(3+)-hydroxamate ABC transporter permease FhuB [Gemmobacter sp. 24YEA27]
MRALLILLPGLAALVLFALNAGTALPGRWPAAILWADPGDIPALILHLSAAPRLVTAALAGAALALAGALLQRVFRNPIAEPATLGITAGAQCALTLTLLNAPGLAPAWLPLPAFAGALAALALVLALAALQGVSSLTLILSGLVVTTSLGGLNAVLTLFHHEVLQSLFLWQAGSLEQEGWTSAARLAPALALALVLAPFARRPLEVLALGDQGARVLGLAPGGWRVMLATAAVSLAALVTALTGVFAFLGIIAPLVARALTGRAPGTGAIAVTGAGILMLADQLVQLLRPWIPVQTGTLLALIGAVLMIALLRKSSQPAPEHLLPALPRRTRPVPRLPLLLLGLLALFAAALAIGRGPEGWDISPLAMFDWRVPRVAGAAAAGAAFGLAGCLIQRLTGNPLASPELLGISGAAALGLVLGVVMTGGGGRGLLYGATSLGALAGLVLILAAGARLRFSSEGLLLAGLAVSMLLSAVLAMLLASGHPLAGQLMTWLSGSTYRIALSDAVIALSVTAALLGLALLLRRWLDLLPLGPDAARLLGLPLTRARASVVVLAALATAVGTILTGPPGFIGLIAPAIARFCGPPRASAQLPLATICGAALMVLADWLGRNLAFPWQIPAGMMALLCGGVFLMIFLARRPA